MNDKIQTIREKCIEANPEIVELKFGCEIQLYDEDMTIATLIGGIGKCTRHKKATNCNEDCDIESALWVSTVESDPKELYEPTEWIIEKSRTDLYKILGRPIRLADVLLAIGPDNQPITVDANGIITSFKANPKDWESPIFDKQVDWNLRADDLEKQSPETIEFLYDLLK